FDFVPALADDVGADEVTRLSVPDHLCAADAAKRAQRREQIDRFENVGLALRVVAEQQVKTGRKIDIQPREVAEITKSQMAQMHGQELLALPGDVKPQSAAVAPPPWRFRQGQRIALSSDLIDLGAIDASRQSL